MSSDWVIVVGAGLATLTLKGFGPLLLGAQRLPPSLTSVLSLLGPALLAGLVASQVLTDSRRLVLDERAVAVGLAALAVWRWKVPPVGAFAIGACTAAALRLVAPL